LIENKLKDWARQLGFQQLGITDTRLPNAEKRLQNWLDNSFHGQMHYMQRHGLKRSRPGLLQPGTIRVISVRMDYLTQSRQNIQQTLDNPQAAYISRYALGRDYHKVLRKRLQKLADRLQAEIGSFGYRVFVDSAPVMETDLAEKAGLGWIGKHSLVIHRQHGSWFFLGEIYTDLPLQIDTPASNHCGQCTACMDICPTGAIVAPYNVDAKRCISYLTIELAGAIPETLRPLIGNRIYGCDDCQIVCPWNRFARQTETADFSPRHNLDKASLLHLFSWSEAEFLKKTEGSAIRRIGFERWSRNIAVALGNAPSSADIIRELKQRLSGASELLREHIVWALHRHRA